MQVIKEFQKAVSNEIKVVLPDDFLDQEIEITIKQVSHQNTKRKNRKTLFNALRLDTRGFKFNREEAHER